MSVSDPAPYFHRHFDDSAALLAQCRDLVAEPAVAAADALLAGWMHDGKLLVCGSGATVGLAATLCGYLNGHLEHERMALAALSLNHAQALPECIAPEQHFARQIHALGKQHDILLLISTLGTEACLQQAVAAAHDRQMQVIALTGGDGGTLAAQLTLNDLLINIPHRHPLRVLEAQTVLLHALCGYIDHLLLDGGGL